MLIDTSTISMSSTLSKVECVDTHAHLNFKAFEADLGEIIKQCLAENLWLINVGTKYETSKRAVEIAEKYKKGVFAAIGLHPIHLATGLIKIKADPEEGGFTAEGEDFHSSKYKSLAQSSSKVVAIGEIGLDYYYKPKAKGKLELFKKKQKELLLEQLKLARELDLPVIFHCRKAHDDLIEVLKEFEKIKGVIHCFTGKWKQAKEYLNMGFYLGFNGIIYKLDLKKIIEKTPIEKILIETDSPYLTPPQAGKERNEPLFVKYIVRDIAKIKKIDYDEVARTTTQNAKKLFKI